MNELLHGTGGAVARWLESRLPSLSSNWWTEQVVNRLTFQQQRLVEEKRIQSLAGLDLAALLRVLDQNWNELAGVHPLPREARNWVKELQSVRNRWAHAPVDGLNPADAFRDGDTLGRLLQVVGADADLAERVERFKMATLARIAPTTASAPSEPKTVVEDTAPAAAPQKYAIGQLLCLRSVGADSNLTRRAD